MQLIIKQVEDKIIELRNQKFILDSDLAELYNVETRDINKAVKNNPEKFLEGYVIELTTQEKLKVVENFHHLEKLKFSKVNPKAFSEKGLYMLATILKSSRAVEATIAIVETFAKVREVNRTFKQAQRLPEGSTKQKSLMEHAGDLVADLFMTDDELDAKSSETIFELNLAMFKIKKIIKKSN